MGDSMDGAVILTNGESTPNMKLKRAKQSVTPLAQVPRQNGFAA